MKRITVSIIGGALGMLLILAITAGLYGCAATPTHNQYGGYTPACGDLPPLLGDDC